MASGVDVNSSVTFHFNMDEKRAVAMLYGVLQATSPAGLTLFFDSVYIKYLQARAEARFDNEGDSAVGGPWAQLAASTIAIRKDLGFGPGPINVRTGQLRAWATDDEAAYFPGASSLRVRYPARPPRGKLREKVKTAQWGARARGGRDRVPARPVVGMDGQDVVFFLGSYGKWLDEFIRHPLPLVDLGV